jgi:WD40 repeat protein
MRVLEVGNTVFLLRFLPDNRGLVVATHADGRGVKFAVLPLSGGDRVALHVPRARFDAWSFYAGCGNAIAVHPAGQSCYIAWAGRLYHFRTADGKSLPVPKGIEANQLALSPNGKRLVAAKRTYSDRRHLSGVNAGGKGGSVVWRQTAPRGFSQVAGFLPDGERFVTIEEVVRIRSFATGDELAAGRHKPVGSKQPQVSQDGRHLVANGYHSLYFWDLTTLDKPRRISGSSAFGDFRSFAFHPDGKTVAVIHGGPTLVKVYDLATLERVHTWKWKLGPLQSVAFSPDGTLGAAGSVDGRVVVWDVDA